MKYVIVIPDGAADAAQDSLGGRTPFQAARTPAMDSLAARGTVGLTNHVPDSLPPGSEVACMSLLGYDPLECFTGRAPLEAAAHGITLGADDCAVRCNLVTIGTADGEPIMDDFTAGHITTEEATELLAAAQRGLTADFPGLDGWEFKPGVSYRNLLLHRGRPGAAPLGGDLRATPPHDLMDKPVADSFPRGTGSRLLTDIMSRSAAWLEGHPVNKARIAAGRRPATHVWLWGVGRAPAMEPFSRTYGMSGTMITAVDLLRGLAALAGWKRLEVPGATGYLDTDYAAKGRHAIAELDRTDLVCVHVEAPDEASHQGDAAAKVKAIEEIDAKIVAPIAAYLANAGDHRILVCPDHPTFLATKTHSRGHVPFVMAGAGIPPAGQRTYDEVAAGASGETIEPGWRMMGEFLGSKRA
ncbi:MAG: cofactor-independent phosphoglycerate mutase [Planctomycetia bacterium]|nr:cofactor-independent phosphoglycerate mutase [Planctomycetia bacterium]